MFAKNTEVGKAAFIAQKAIAAAQIAINTETQVSDIISATRKAVNDDQDFGPILGPIKAAIDIAIGAAEVAGTIANGIKQATTINSVNPQGFAKGGLYLSDGYGAYIEGPGSGTSDSVNARLSNGEAIINARSTEMFAPIQSAVNQCLQLLLSKMIFIYTAHPFFIKPVTPTPKTRRLVRLFPFFLLAFLR